MLHLKEIMHFEELREKNMKIKVQMMKMVLAQPISGDETAEETFTDELRKRAALLITQCYC